jgi:hypothetical protein
MLTAARESTLAPQKEDQGDPKIAHEIRALPMKHDDAINRHDAAGDAFGSNWRMSNI